MDDDFDIYDAEKCEAILLANKVQIEWDEYNRRAAKICREAGLPDGEWLIHWGEADKELNPFSSCGRQGTHLGGSKDKVKDGRHRAALYVYLRLKGIDAMLAHDLTKLYCNGIASPDIIVD